MHEPNGGKIPLKLEKKLQEDFGVVQQFKDAFKAGGCDAVRLRLGVAGAW